MSGKTLLRIIKEDESSPEQLQALGVTDHSLVRINRQGDIELRRTDRWDAIGGLIGDFEARVKRQTGLEWA